MRQFIFAAAALLAAGCGSDPDFACDVTQTAGGVTSHACSEINGIEPAQADEAADSCLKIHGVVVDSCSTDGEVGVCTVTQGGLTQSLHFYSEGGFTAELGEKGCTSIKGTWTPS